MNDPDEDRDPRVEGDTEPDADGLSGPGTDDSDADDTADSDADGTDESSTDDTAESDVTESDAADGTDVNDADPSDADPSDADAKQADADEADHNPAGPDEAEPEKVSLDKADADETDPGETDPGETDPGETDADAADPGEADTDDWVAADDGAETTVLPVVDDESHRLAYTQVSENPPAAPGDSPNKYSGDSSNNNSGDSPADNSGDNPDEGPNNDAESEPERRSRSGALANPLRVVLTAAIIGALIAGAIGIFQGIGDGGDVANTGIGGKEKLAKNAFTESAAGDCLDWAAGNPGDPKKVDCQLRHRFEVAGPLDTALLPGSEFGESAPWPGVARFAQIRDEQCAVIADRYLGGKRDPHGRFSVSMMFPSQVQWDKGARELRCGLQQTGPDGQPAQFSGRVADQDQSFKWAPGTCVGIDAARKPTVEVNCTENHAFQTTGTVDLSVKFGDRLSGRPWPSKDEQNAFLASVCPGQAERFMGGKAKLEATTLNTQWSVILEPSWLAGSRTAVCYLGLPDQGGFATLVGDARETLLINGKLPVPPPQAPPGRALPTPVPLPGGYEANPVEVPAPAG